ncbi:hypothetical protein GCM10011529_30000 [Polymorphobacter glacialis]|uniref:Uncharacterized protein n=1 Tax=Sandarakinorhabdus glacialis TaxID=1614636 RepID=A0A917EC41_9SPHN|nr:hypothetical protein GCM10011529_30000 [Polymorphobacter glacialis]
MRAVCTRRLHGASAHKPADNDAALYKSCAPTPEDPTPLPSEVEARPPIQAQPSIDPGI